MARPNLTEPFEPDLDEEEEEEMEEDGEDGCYKVNAMNDRDPMVRIGSCDSMRMEEEGVGGRLIGVLTLLALAYVVKDYGMANTIAFLKAFTVGLSDSFFN